MISSRPRFQRVENGAVRVSVPWRIWAAELVMISERSLFVRASKDLD